MAKSLPSRRSSGRPRLLDLFTCQGGARHGYELAGWDTDGVDIMPQPRSPYEVIVADALEYVRGHGHEYQAIHASPPCQGYSKAQRLRGNDHDRLVAATREELERTGLPFVIENVEGARDELEHPVMLCGTMFGLRLYRHRLFETNWPLTAPLHGEHYLRQVKMGRKPAADEILQPVGNFTDVDSAREAMGMPWANRDGLREAIPPAYTEYIGRCLMAAVADAETQEAA